MSAAVFRAVGLNLHNCSKQPPPQLLFPILNDASHLIPAAPTVWTGTWEFKLLSRSGRADEVTKCRWFCALQLVVWISACQSVLAQWPLPPGRTNLHHAWAEQLQHRKQTTVWSTSLSSWLLLSLSLSSSSGRCASFAWLLTQTQPEVLTHCVSADWQKNPPQSKTSKPPWQISVSLKDDPHCRFWHKLGPRHLVVWMKK